MAFEGGSPGGLRPSTTELRDSQAGQVATRTLPPGVPVALKLHRPPPLRIARDLVIDSIAIAAACAVAALTVPADATAPSPVALVTFGLATIGLLAGRGIYARRVWTSYLDDLRAVVVSTAVAAMGVASLSLLLSNNVDAADGGLRVWLYALAYLAAVRAATRLAELGLRRRPGIGRPTLIVGEPETARLLANRLFSEPQLGLRPLALLGSPYESGVESLDGDLEALIREHRIEHAVLCMGSPFGQEARELGRRLVELGIAVSVLSQHFDGIPDRVVIERPAGLPLVRVPRSDSANWGLLVKYAVDRVIAGLLLLVLTPLILFAAAGVALELGRPIFFRQRRVGRRGEEFEILKFRTLSGSPAESGEADADWAERELAGDADGPERELATGPLRETRVGQVLRTTGIDELPQLINVLRGEMSIIGPRPEREKYVRRFAEAIPRYADRHRVKPGITGWAQVNGLRGKSSLAQRVELDNYYIENWSFWLDLKILLLTVVAVFRGSPK
jgi:exopolysaccharide biosynthesis polyprenyl glycosylphosphotransferase